MPAAGHAYLFALPFELLVEAAPVREIPIRHGDLTATVYWPFRNRAEPIVGPTWIDLSRVPRRPHTEPPHLRAPIPLATPNPVPGTLRADAVRIDLFGVEAGSGSDLAQDLLLRFLGLIRFRTHQWWVKRPHNEFERLPRNGFDINRRGELAGGVSAVVSVEARRGDERDLMGADFPAICASLAAGEDIPLAWDLFFDALFFVMAGQSGMDIRRSILDAANACEVSVLTAASRLGERQSLTARQVLKTLDTSDLLFNLRVGLSKLADRDFSAEAPAAYHQIYLLWRARGAVAHGRLPGIKLGRPLPTLGQFHEMIQGVETLLAWLDGV